jgi:lipopolysaccharide transport system permease protein
VIEAATKPPASAPAASGGVAARPHTAASGQIPPETLLRPTRGLVGANWGELIRHRELFSFLMWRDFKVRYKQTVLGLGWAVLQPVIFMLVFAFIALQLKIDTKGVPLAVFYFAGMLPWTFYSVGVQFSSQSLVNQQHLLTKVYLPRLFIPASVIMTGLVDMAVAFAVLAGIMAFTGVWPTLSTLLLVPLCLLLVIVTLGFGLLFSALTVAYRDIRFIVPFFVQGMMFVSSVIVPSWTLGENARWILAANPVSGIIEGFRAALSGGRIAPDWPVLGLAAAGSLALFFVGLFVFKSIERRFADIA